MHSAPCSAERFNTNLNRKDMNRTGYILIGLLLVGLGSARAQGKLSKAYAQPVPNEKAIQLKWIIPVPVVAQYHVLRKATGEKFFKQLTTKPLQAITAVDAKDPAAVAEARRNYLEFTKSLPDQKDDVQLYLKMFAMNAYTSNEFARAAGMYYTDYSVVTGQTYEYAVSAIFNGKSYSWAISLPVRAGNHQPLSAPVGLNVVQEKTRRVALSWTIRPDVLAYHVYRRRESGGEVRLNKKPVVVVDALNGNRPSTQFTDTDSTLRAGETYYYRIAALDPFVNVGEFSQAAWLTLKDMDPPLGVSALQGRVDKKGVRLSWQPSPSRDCIGYRLFRGTAIDKPFQPALPRLLAAADTIFTDETAVEGATYYYYLRAEDQAGNGVNTTAVQVTHPDLTPPALPAGLTVQTDTTGHVTLHWRVSPEADLRGYFVYRALRDDPDNYAQLQSTPLSATMYRDSLPRNNRNAFHYRVTAVDQHENESTPARLTVRLPDRQPPRAPMLTASAADADSVRLAWKPVSDDVRSYQVLRRMEVDAPVDFQVVGRTSGTRFVDRNVPGGTYSYALMAIDSAGNYSKQSMPNVVEVAGKYALTAPKDVKIKLAEREKTLMVSWTQPPQPANFSGYRVVVRSGDETFRAVTPVLTDAQAVLTDWEAGTDYEIAVVAISQTGQQLRSTVVKAVPHK